MVTIADAPAARPLDCVAERVGEAMRRLGVPGAVVGILRGGEEYAAGFGVTNVRHPLPVDGDTLFRVVSVTNGYGYGHRYCLVFQRDG